MGQIVINVEQFDSDSNLRDRRIRHDFLESTAFPLATFDATSIEGIPELETIGAGSTGRAYIYTKDPRKVQQHIPLVFDATPAQPDGLEWKTAGESRFAGATYYYILSAAYGDGV